MIHTLAAIEAVIIVGLVPWGLYHYHQLRAAEAEARTANKRWAEALDDARRARLNAEVHKRNKMMATADANNQDQLARRKSVVIQNQKQAIAELQYQINQLRSEAT